MHAAPYNMNLDPWKGLPYIVPHVVVPCGIWQNIYRASDTLREKNKISRDFQVRIRGKIGRFRGIFAGEKSNFKRFSGQILRKIGQFYGKFRGKLRQETISKKQPISLDCFWQILLKSINFATI